MSSILTPSPVGVRPNLAIPGMPAVFGGKVSLFPNLTEAQSQRIAQGFHDDRIHDPAVRAIKGDIQKALTSYGRFGCYNEFGEFDPSVETYVKDLVKRGFMKEDSGRGFVSPDKTPFFFNPIPELREIEEEQPDTSYMDFMTSSAMTLEVEKRDEWKLTGDFRFVLMKTTGQVRYASIANDTRELVMINDEYGAGINISWTWFETNRFNITMARMAPKFKFAAFNMQADHVYNLFVAAAVGRDFATLNINSGVQRGWVVWDLNLAIAFFNRFQDTFNLSYPFQGKSYRIIAPPEARPILDPIFNPASYAFGVKPTTLSARVNITYTNKLNADGLDPYKIYLVVDKWEQNEIGTRIPLEAHGPEDDIDHFATKLTYRLAYGVNIDPNSIITLEWDPETIDFSIWGPVEVRGVVDTTP